MGVLKVATSVIVASPGFEKENSTGQQMDASTFDTRIGYCGVFVFGVQ